MTCTHRFKRCYMINVLICAVGVWACALPAMAQRNLIESVALLDDPTASLGVADVLDADFQPVNHTMTLWYTASAKWLRLRILPAPDNSDVVLLVRPPMLDSVELYAPILSDAANSAGIEFQRQFDEWPSPLRGYRISPPEGGADYYVRIISTGPLVANVTAQRRAAAVRLSLSIDLFQIGYLAFMFILFVWALRMMATTQDRLFGWFAAMQATWIFHNTLLLGYVGALIPTLEGEVTTLLFRNSVIVASLVSLVFHRAMLIRFKPTIWAIWSLNTLIAMMGVAIVVFWLNDSRLGLKLHTFCVAAAPIVFLFNAYTARISASPGLMVMRVIYTILSAALLWWILSISVYGDSWLVSLYGYMLHGTTVGVLMFIVLHLHAQNLVVLAQKASGRLAEIEYRSVLEQEKIQTLAQFLDMLSHEAKNALSVINMSISGQSITARQRTRVTDAILGLSNVIDRCNQTIRLDSNDQTILQEDCDLVEILHQHCASAVEPSRIALRTQGKALMKGDPVLLGVIFSNLIDNALKYSPPASEVSIWVDMAHECHVIQIENMKGAAGMPDPANVFEKYYRSQRAKTQIGSGLGLYIVRGLVLLLGGQITYKPHNNRVRFKVCFPC